MDARYEFEVVELKPVWDEALHFLPFVLNLRRTNSQPEIQNLAIIPSWYTELQELLPIGSRKYCLFVSLLGHI